MNGCKNYNTKQKSIILDSIRNNQEQHYTADELLDILKQNNTPVGRATLYRYLDFLVQIGEVKRFYIEEGMGACYQNAGGNCHDHHHLKCNNCGKLLHADLNAMSLVNEQIKKVLNFEVDCSRLVFYGLCEECQNEKHD